MILNEPHQFRRGEIAVDFEAGFAFDDLATAGLDQFSARRIAAPALPDDRMVQWFTRRFIEDDERLALVGDADAEKVMDRGVASEHGSNRGDRVVPDLLGIVLDPAG